MTKLEIIKELECQIDKDLKLMKKYKPEDVRPHYLDGRSDGMAIAVQLIKTLLIDGG